MILYCPYITIPAHLGTVRLPRSRIPRTDRAVNRIGGTADPCETPASISSSSPSLHLNMIPTFRSLVKESVHLSKSGSSPKRRNLAWYPRQLRPKVPLPGVYLATRFSWSPRFPRGGIVAAFLTGCSGSPRFKPDGAVCSWTCYKASRISIRLNVSFYRFYGSIHSIL